MIDLAINLICAWILYQLGYARGWAAAVRRR